MTGCGEPARSVSQAAGRARRAPRAIVELVRQRAPWKDVIVAARSRAIFARAGDLLRGDGRAHVRGARSGSSAERSCIEAGRRAEGEDELEKALAFYRSVGATFFIQRARGCWPRLRALRRR